jgi:hypothetical protein
MESILWNIFSVVMVILLYTWKKTLHEIDFIWKKYYIIKFPWNKHYAGTNISSQFNLRTFT